MKNKKVSSIIIFLAIIVIIVVGIAIKVAFAENNNENNEVSTVGGEIIKVSEGGVTFQANPDNLGSQFYVGTSNVPIFDTNGNRVDSRKLKKGQQILVEFTGGILETFPQGFTDVVKIIVE